MSADRAVTEVLGYVLILAIVTITLAAVMTLGVGGLESAQQSEQLNNMERAFDVLDHNIQTLVHQGAPSRGTEVRLLDGTLKYGDQTSILVYAEGEDPEDAFEIVTHPIVYEGGNDRQIVYEAGGIFYTGAGGSMVLKDPAIHVDDEYLLISGTRTRALTGSDRTVDSDGTVLIRKEYLGTDILSKSPDSTENVIIEIESDRADAWEAYLENRDVLIDDDPVTAKVTVSEEVIITQARIRVEFSQ